MKPAGEKNRLLINPHTGKPLSFSLQTVIDEAPKCAPH